MFQNDADYASIDQGDELRFTDLRNAVQSGTEVEVTNVTKGETYTMEHDLSEREIEMVLEGSQVGVVRKEFADERETETA
jgi:aconitate hydratase